MARTTPPAADTATYHGEVWTDARGYATVRLPADAAPLSPPFEYALRPMNGEISVSIAAGLHGGRFTIATDQPHIKVAWRVSRHEGEPQ
jgi:hypothetical protein